LGSVVIDHTSGSIRIFNTHLHADYCDNAYSDIRLLQAYQVSQTIKNTTRCGEYVIVCGDFNHLESELGMQAIRVLAGVSDSVHSATRQQSNNLVTLNRDTNPYVSRNEIPKRIDYILHSSNIKCTQMGLAMQNHKESGMHFSDHDGFFTVMELTTDLPSPDQNTDELSVLLPIMHEIKLALYRAQQINWIKMLMFTLIFAVFIMSPIFELYGMDCLPLNYYFGNVGLFLLQIVVVVACAGAFIIQLVNTRVEVNAYKNALNELQTKVAFLKMA